jgi:fibrillarin-like pre-rRNA processing protein
MSTGTEAKQLQEQISLAKQENKQLRDTLEQLAARKLLADYSLVTDKRAIPCGLSAVHVIIRNGKQCNLATKCIIQDDPVHEDLVKVEGQMFRVWSPFRSKLAAAIITAKMSKLPLSSGNKIMMIGGLQDTAHLSDIVQKYGFVYCVKNGLPLSMHKNLSKRSNVVLIDEDSRYPERYKNEVKHKLDTIIADIDDVNGIDSFGANIRQFLKASTRFFVVVRSSEEQKMKEELTKRHYCNIEDILSLAPFDEEYKLFMGTITK